MKRYDCIYLWQDKNNHSSSVDEQHLRTLVRGAKLFAIVERILKKQRQSRHVLKSLKDKCYLIIL